MELAEKYAYEVYRKKSFSGAAKALFISQPSLSAMVKKLEAGLGFLIFDRSKSPLKLTPQGKIYMAYLEESMENELLMLNRVRSLTAPPSRTLSVGGGSFFSLQLNPIACQRLRRMMPELLIKLDMGSSVGTRNLREKLDLGLLDLCVSYTNDHIKYEILPLLEERYYFTIRRDHSAAAPLVPYSLSLDEVLSGQVGPNSFDRKTFIPSGIPLVRHVSLPTMDLKNYINEFPSANIRIQNMQSGEIFYDFMLRGLGADISSDLIIAAKRKKSQDVLFFPIGLPHGKRTASVIYKKGTSLSEEAKAFISILQDLCADRKRLYDLLAE